MILELFSCAGGMAEGLRRAGLQPDVAVEWDADHAASYRANLSHVPLVEDARELLRAEFRAEQGIRDVELLVADPPCTPWSTAGKRRGLADERDMLRATCDIIAAIRPRCWLIANVPGLVTNPNAHVVASTIGAIEGYEFDYFRLDAADFGVPQRRRRPFWFGRPRGMPKLHPPEPTHIDPMRVRTLWDLRRLPWVTCREALGHLPLEELGRPVRMAIKQRDVDHAHDLDSPARALTAANARSPLRAKHEPNEPERPAQTVTAGARSGRTCLRYSPQHPPADMDRPAPTWPWDRPATTVTADDRRAPLGHHSGSFLSDANAIVLSERARLILQGFPDDWHIAGATKKKRAAAIGMAMPPPLAEAVGRQIAAWMARVLAERRVA